MLVMDELVVTLLVVVKDKEVVVLEVLLVVLVDVELLVVEDVVLELAVVEDVLIEV